jgi:hypothetical protein
MLLYQYKAQLTDIPSFHRENIMVKKLIRTVAHMIFGAVHGSIWAALALHFDWCTGPNWEWNLCVVIGVSLVCHLILLAIFTAPTPATT